MRKLLNTLYVTSENSYLSLDGENVVVWTEREGMGMEYRCTIWKELSPLGIGEPARH